MKSSILMFVAGAVMASALVLFVVGGRKEATPVEPAAQTTSTPVPSTPLETPEAEDAQTATADPARLQPEPKPAKPSAMPPRENRRSASSRPATSTPRPSTPAPAAQTPAPSSQPSQTAQNTPPPQQQGPMIPMTPTDIPPLSPETTKPVTEDRKPAPRPEPKTVTIPAGTLFSVRLDEALSSSRNQTGDSFRATLDQPLVVDGFVIAERGSRVEGRVSEVDAGGRVRGVSRMAVELVRLTTSDGQRVRLQTEGFTKQGEKDTKKDVAKIGAAAGIGAAIGAIAGGGKGAAIGAAVGGAAGTGGVMATRGAAAELPAETRLSFRLREPITITEKL